MQHNRTKKVLGEEALSVLGSSRVILFGVGGVGSYAGEALVRSGLGHLTIVDKDVVDMTNINRQLVALHSTVGMEKVTVAAQRYKDINPDMTITALAQCITADNVGDFHLETYDYVIDAIDMVTAKLAIIEDCAAKGVPVISCMGTGNKLQPNAFMVAPVEKTSVCPLAKVMRRELKARGIKGVKVVYSKEEPQIKCTPPGSVSFVPGAAGLLLAGEVIKTLGAINCSGEKGNLKSPKL